MSQFWVYLKSLGWRGVRQDSGFKMRGGQTKIYGPIYITLARRVVIFNLSFSEPPGDNR